MLHSHGDDQRRHGDRRALRGALALVAVFAVVDVVAGYAAGSLALLADAGHMVSDAGSLGLAIFAAWLASRPASPERSFGYQRAEILAALANGVALVAIAIWIVVEALQRLREPRCAKPLAEALRLYYALKVHGVAARQPSEATP